MTDPVLDYDPKSARTSFRSAQAVAQHIDDKHLAIPNVIDTHAHADHLTAMPFFKKRYGARTVTGSRVGEVQRSFRDIYNLGADFPVDGRQFDLLLDEGQDLEVGLSESEPCTRLGAHRRTCPGKSTMRFLSAILFGLRPTFTKKVLLLFVTDRGRSRFDVQHRRVG